MSTEVKELELTDEMKERLRGFAAIEVVNEFQYVPRACRQKDDNGAWVIPKNLWPVFTLRGLDGIQQTMKGDALDVQIDANGKPFVAKSNTGKIAVDVCRKGVVTWRNWRTAEGALVSIGLGTGQGENLRDEDLGKLPPNIMFELCNAITEQSLLTEEELVGLT